MITYLDISISVAIQFDGQSWMRMTFLLKWVSLQRQDLLHKVTVVLGSVARYEQRFAATDYVSELFKGNQILAG
jgi:hypothetical protein